MSDCEYAESIPAPKCPAAEERDRLRAEISGLEASATRGWEMADSLHMTVRELRAEIEKLRGIKPEMPPFPPEGKGLPRYGIRWNGPEHPLAVQMADGYWVPWHLADAEIQNLEASVENLDCLYESRTNLLRETEAENKKLRSSLRGLTEWLSRWRHAIRIHAIGGDTAWDELERLHNQGAAATKTEEKS